MVVNGKKKKKKDNYKNGSREVENEISNLSLPLYGKKNSRAFWYIPFISS